MCPRDELFQNVRKMRKCWYFVQVKFVTTFPEKKFSCLECVDTKMTMLQWFTQKISPFDSTSFKQSQFWLFSLGVQFTTFLINKNLTQLFHRRILTIFNKFLALYHAEELHWQPMQLRRAISCVFNIVSPEYPYEGGQYYKDIACLLFQIGCKRAEIAIPWFS